MVDFKWLKPGQGQVVVAPPKAPDAPPIVGVVVPPAVDIAKRTGNTVWQGGGAFYIVAALLPNWPLPAQVALAGLLAGALAFVRSWLAHRKVAHS